MKRTEQTTIAFNPLIINEDVFTEFIREVQTDLAIHSPKDNFNNRVITISALLKSKWKRLYKKQPVGTVPKPNQSKTIFIYIDPLILNENTFRRLLRGIRDSIESGCSDKNANKQVKTISMLLFRERDVIYGKASSSDELEERLKVLLWVHLNTTWLPLRDQRLQPRDLGAFGLEIKAMQATAICLRDEFFSKFFEDKDVRDSYKEFFLRKPPNLQSKGNPALWSRNSNFFRYLRDFDTDAKESD
tara:strand:+ start:227 stop:961 length:735 start_codon:yes stop_codon:yes gene_type:complete